MVFNPFVRLSATGESVSVSIESASREDLEITHNAWRLFSGYLTKEGE